MEARLKAEVDKLKDEIQKLKAEEGKCHVLVNENLHLQEELKNC